MLSVAVNTLMEHSPEVMLITSYTYTAKYEGCI